MTDCEMTAVAEAVGVLPGVPDYRLTASDVAWSALIAVMFYAAYLLVALMEGPY